MKKRWSFVLIFSFIAAVSASAQTRTVTNEDLEKYRQKRVVAERDLRENYERLGFPSPAELEKQIERSRAERSALATRLEAENLERAGLNLERERVENERRIRNYQSPPEKYQRDEDDYFYNSAPNGFYGFPVNPFDRFNRGGFGGRQRGRYRRNYDNQPRIEYRNNLPVVIQPTRTTRWNAGRN